MTRHTSDLQTTRVGRYLDRVMRRLRLPPAVSTAVGVASFVTWGIAVVATASLIALQIQ